MAYTFLSPRQTLEFSVCWKEDGHREITWKAVHAKNYPVDCSLISLVCCMKQWGGKGNAHIEKMCL